ncbi:hypothetical protein [Microbacterium sp.]|uniref:hypothetical protein n=1 Tax=Microbacterium sp. TaxID=51671 RepID=UPI00391CD257
MIFVAAAAVVWVAGIQLSKATDVLDARLHLGSALGGLIVRAAATNLPEIATVSAAISGNLDVAVGNTRRNSPADGRPRDPRRVRQAGARREAAHLPRGLADARARGPGRGGVLAVVSPERMRPTSTSPPRRRC